jgi:hypothetical protein
MPFVHSRRDLLRFGLGLGVGSRTAALLAASRVQSSTLTFRLEEKAGLRRFGYPVYTTLPPGTPTDHAFRLSRDDGRAIPAQFRIVRGRDGESVVALDYTSNIAPSARESYVVSHEPKGAAVAEPKGRQSVERSEGLITVGRSSIRFEMADNLRGFLRAVVNDRLSYLREGGAGLVLVDKSGRRSTLGETNEDKGTTRGSVIREGPFAVAVHYECQTALAGLGVVSSEVTMTFPSSKSWVEASWSVEDPNGWVAGMGLALNISTDASPTLVDFGADSTVYSTLKTTERMELSARSRSDVDPNTERRWEIRRGGSDTLEPFARAMGSPPRPAEGWAHIMDKTRCTAAAMADFGREHSDRIEVQGDGGLGLWRNFAVGDTPRGGGRKTLKLWLHFVSMPVQLGAVTSPQAMLNPLSVVWEKSGA